jgi:eukaryotic-like serine/threonine-protein kinase
MNLTQLDEEGIFQAARKIEAGEARSAYLNEICGGDRGLRDRLEALLHVYEQERSFLESPPIEVIGSPVLDVHPLAEGPGAVIGSYTLRELIGEGGMGVVYVAEQTQPVRRKVALKIIKPGMDTRQVIARFEAERQALAMMDHPNIAKVHEGGATGSGRPYFVMELVRGIPITEYCDRERLSIPQRLELIVQVCRAVQHAHQKGIIHRDLKPSNILVTIIDGAAVPKVIDFGVAKATGASLTERTIYTAFHQFLGTPLYMSPEQADLSGMDVDTRSDIYSVGVLLYELLTGTTPFDENTFREAAFDEVRRIIREQEPPKPSTRLSELSRPHAPREDCVTRSVTTTVTSIAAQRRTEAAKLPKLVRGELDWIVMKALEKDRRRRYETANDFASDVMRYLTDEPVQACPPSAWYRLRKFARRNRVALTTAGFVVAALIAGATVSAWQAVRARRAEAEAERRAKDTELVVKSLINDVIGAAAPAEARGQPIRVVVLLKMAEGTLPARFRGRPLAEAAFRRALAGAYLDLDYREEAEQQIDRAVALRTELLGPQHPDTLEALAFQVKALRVLGATHRGKQEEAIRLGRRVLESHRRALGTDRPETLATMSGLGWALLQHGDFREARDVLERALNGQLQVLGADAPETLVTLDALGHASHGLGQLDDAETLLRRAGDLRERAFGRQHWYTLDTLQTLGLVLRDQGRIEEAVALFRDVIAGSRALHGSPYFGGGRYLCGELVDALRDQGNWAAIRELCEGWLRELLELPPEPDPSVRSMKMVTLSCMAFWLAELPADFPIDRELALRAAELAAEQGNDLRDNNWTRLAVVHLRRGDPARAQWAVKESMKRRKGGDRFDWLAQALIVARRGELDRSRDWFDRAAAGDDGGLGPGVGYGLVRREVATLLGMPPESRETHLHGPREFRDEAVPPPRATSSDEEVERRARRGATEEGGVVRDRDAAVRVPGNPRDGAADELPGAARRVIRPHETPGQPEAAAEWSAKFGQPDLPANVFAWP